MVSLLQIPKQTITEEQLYSILIKGGEGNRIKKVEEKEIDGDNYVCIYSGDFYFLDDLVSKYKFQKYILILNYSL